MEFMVRVETRVTPQEGGTSIDAFAEAMLQALATVDLDADMASGTREGIYNFWTLVDADAPDVAASEGTARVRGAAQNVVGHAATTRAQAQSVEAYPNDDPDPVPAG